MKTAIVTLSSVLVIPARSLDASMHCMLAEHAAKRFGHTRKLTESVTQRVLDDLERQTLQDMQTALSKRENANRLLAEARQLEGPGRRLFGARLDRIRETLKGRSQ